MLSLIKSFLRIFASSAEATVYWFDSAPWTTYGEHNPAILFTQADGAHTAKQMGGGGSIYWRSKSPDAVLRTYYSVASGRNYALYCDGALINDNCIPGINAGGAYNSGSGAYQTFTIGSGLDTSQVHTYELMCYYPYKDFNSWLDSYLDLDGAGLDTTAPVTPHPLVVGYGDSIMGLSNFLTDTSGSATVLDVRKCAWWIASHATQKAMYISGVGGGRVTTTGRDGTSALPTWTDIFITQYGTNDLSFLPSGNATFQADYATMLTNVETRIGTTKRKIMLQPFPRTGDTGQRAIAAGLITNAIAISGISNAGYSGTDNWINPTSGVDTSDGLHPNIAGYAKIGNRLIPILSTYAIGIVGPAAGAPNNTSSTFTVTLSNGATFTGDQDITLTASGSSTITATAAGGAISSNGTSTVTVTPANGVVNFTFTCTSPSLGTTTITPSTTQQLWTMPSAPAYICSTSSNRTPAFLRAASMMGF